MKREKEFYTKLNPADFPQNIEELRIAGQVPENFIEQAGLIVNRNNLRRSTETIGLSIPNRLLWVLGQIAKKKRL